MSLRPRPSPRAGRVGHGVAWLAGVLALAAAPPVVAADSAVIFMYHRFGDGRFPSTNVRIEQFEAHLGELARGDYTVMAVADILAALRDGRALPDRTVGITIDDAYRSVYTEAWPRLRRAGHPFTLFVATDPIDRQFRDYMSWDEIRELRDAGVAVGSQTASHLHMAANDAARNRDDLARSNARFTAELGAPPKLFAYPFGEASLEVMDVVRKAGFTFAFGQHSGVLHTTSDPFYMPRFSMNEKFGDAARFRQIANALPLPVTDVAPANPTLRANPPLFGFTLVGEPGRIGEITCFDAGGLGQLRVERVGPRIEVRLDVAYPPGRARINCTSFAGNGRWRWFGTQFFVPN